MRRKSTHVIVRSHHPRLRRFVIGALAIATLAIGWLLFEYGRMAAGYSLVEAMQREHVLGQRISGLEGENGRLKSQIALFERTAGIDRRAYEEVDRSLTDLQNEVLELRQEVAFYRGIVHSEDATPGLRIQSFKLRQDEPTQYQYRLVLTQLATTNIRVQGEAEIALSGMLNGDPVELAQRDILDQQGQDLRFDFRNFQELRGSLRLPEGFVPQRVMLKAAPKGGKGAGAERTLSWTDVVS